MAVEFSSDCFIITLESVVELKMIVWHWLQADVLKEDGRINKKCKSTNRIQ